MIDRMPQLMEMAESHIRRYAIDACTKELEVAGARTGAEASVVGAAVLARQTFAEEKHG